MKSVILSDKAIREIILALRCMKRNTEKERAYLRKLIKKLGGSASPQQEDKGKQHA